MYLKFYNLTEKPFRIVPNPKSLFLSPRYENALTYLEYGLMEKIGFILLTGEIGMGKTTLIRYLLNKLEPEMDVGVIFNTNVTADQILRLILLEFELPVSEGDKSKDLETLYRYLIEQYKCGKQVLLIVDEAQNLTDDALEEIRMLSNLQSDEEVLMQIMVAGQPELRKKLNKPELAQFSQRIAVGYHLSPLTREECCAYIAHRLTVAGGSPELFLQNALDAIYECSGGIPRTINLICDACLVYGFADEIERIGEHIVQQVIDDKEGMGILPGGREQEQFPVPDSEERPAIQSASLDGHRAAAGAAPHEDYSGEVLQKIAFIAEKVCELETMLGENKALLSKKLNVIQIDGFRKAIRLLIAERKQNAKLLREYGRLQEKYRTLKKMYRHHTLQQ